MPAGASKKREREYEKLKKDFRKEGRYKGREEEVAARIVNKQRRQFGETQTAKRRRRQGEAEDRNLPIANYKQLTVPEVTRKLTRKSKEQLEKIRQYEKKHKNRKTLLKELRKRLRDAA